MRNIFVVVSLAAIAVGIAMFTHSDTTNQAQTSSTGSAQVVAIPFQELAHGSHSTVSKRVNYIVTSNTGLLAIWKFIDAPGQTPQVDFSKYDVIAVFTGDEPTAGYDIKVAKVEDSQSRIVTVSLIKPGSSCVLTDSITNPYQIVELEKTSLTLGHQDQENTISCLQ